MASTAEETAIKERVAAGKYKNRLVWMGHCALKTDEGEKGKGEKDKHKLGERGFLVYTLHYAEFMSRHRREPLRVFWCYLSTLKCSDQDILMVSHGVTLHVRVIDVKAAISPVVKILQMQLSPNEWQKLRIDDKYVKSRPPNGRGLFDRLLGIYERKAMVSKQDLDVSTTAEIKKMARYHLPTLDLWSVKRDSVYIDASLNCLRSAFYLENILLKCDSDYTLFRNLIIWFNDQIGTCFRHAGFDCTNVNDLAKWCRKLVSLTWAPKITGFSFKNMPFTEEHLQLIQQLWNANRYRSISLMNATAIKAQDYLFDAFMNDDLNKYLEMINFDCSPGFRFERMIPRLTNIVSLSLADCDVDIAETMRLIGRFNLDKLRMLNLSGNRANVPFENIRGLKLRRLDMNNVTFANGVFTSFVKFYLGHTWEDKLWLSLSSSKGIAGDFEDGLNMLSACENYNLTEFIWDNNPVQPELLEFIKKSVNLKVLHFSGNASLFDFCDVLGSLMNLEELIVMNYPEEFEMEIQGIIGFASILPKLKLFDIRGNSISGFEGATVTMLCNLIESNLSLDMVAFDSPTMKSTDQLMEIFEAAKRRTRPIFISWPEKAIKACKLKKSRKWNIRIMLQEIANVKYSGTISKFDPPFEAFMANHDIAFPLYFTNRAADILGCSPDGNDPRFPIDPTMFDEWIPEKER